MPAAKRNPNYELTQQETTRMVHDAQYRKQRDARERQLRRQDNIKMAVRAAISLVVLVFGLLLLDGARREWDEQFVRLLSFVPQTQVQRLLAKASEPARQKMTLINYDLVMTDVKGTAKLAFPDGSGVLVQPSTHFEVRLMDYHRNGRRNRNFFLSYGTVFSRISKYFGSSGQTLISTPNAVAAARGTGFSVLFNPANQLTVVEVIESKVILKNAGGRVEIQAGQRGLAQGDSPPVVEPLATNRQTFLRAQLNRLQQVDIPPHPAIATLMKTERGLLNFLDPALQLVGLVPGGWSLQDNDNARRLAAQQRLRDLQKPLADDLPEVLTLHTLSQLSLKQEERDLILRAFADNMLDSYQKTGNNSYVIRARARDSKNTVYEATESSVRELQN